jgi:hypothetical protein
MSGGAYTIFLEGETYSAQVFWDNAAKYFWRFFRLGLWSLPVFAIFFSIQFLEPLVVQLIWGKDPYQYITWWGAWVRVGLGYIGILLYLIVFDYARIRTILHDEHKMRKALWNGITFAFKNFFVTLGISLTLFISGIVLLIMYNPVADDLHAPTATIILMLFILQQLYMYLRMLIRMTLYASQARLYQHRSLRHEPATDSIQSVTIQPAAG